jgi:hypothetical protein
MAEFILKESQLELIKRVIVADEPRGNTQSINESIFSLENMLMLAGFIPVIGEVADIALIIYYLNKGERLYAALMLIALIPTVGDFLVKPIVMAFRGSKTGILAMKGGGAKLSQYLAKNPKVASKFKDLSKYTNAPAVEKTIEGIGKINKGWATSLKNGLKEITGGAAISGVKSGAKQVVAGGTFRGGLKDYFQGERLSKYFAKKGVLPETGIKRWWLNVGARQDRRNAFRRFITANNLLSYFGVPSLSSFEFKMSDDPEFRKKIADDPKTSDYIANNYNSEEDDEQSNKSNQRTSSSNQEKEENDPLGKFLNSLLGV